MLLLEVSKINVILNSNIQEQYSMYQYRLFNAILHFLSSLCFESSLPKITIEVSMTIRLSAITTPLSSPFH